MCKRLLSLSIAALLTATITFVPASAQSQVDQAPAAAGGKIKARVTRIGTGKRAAVRVQLKDNTKLKGYIGEIAQDHFSLVDPKHGTVTPVPYEHVQQIKSTRNPWLFGIVTGAATVGGLLLVVAVSLRGS
jgi:ABC-type amino acid transport substrate-binding protein